MNKVSLIEDIVIDEVVINCMTCIVGLEHAGKVHLAGDSIAIEDFSACSVSDAKVFTVGDLAFGFCGSFRAGQLIKYGFEIPTRQKSKTDMEYLVIDLIESIRHVFKDKGVMKKEAEEESVDAKFLLGYRGCLYYIDEDFQIGRVHDGYCALGAGADIALGSLYTSEKLVHDPRKRLTLALESAVKWSAAVRQPFNYVVLDNHVVKPKKRK